MEASKPRPMLQASADCQSGAPMQQQALPWELAQVLPLVHPFLTPAQRLAVFRSSKSVAEVVVHNAPCTHLSIQADAADYPTQLLVAMQPCGVALELSGSLVPPEPLRPYITSLALAPITGRWRMDREQMTAAGLAEVQLQLRQLPRLDKLGMFSWDFAAANEQQAGDCPSTTTTQGMHQTRDLATTPGAQQLHTCSATAAAQQADNRFAVSGMQPAQPLATAGEHQPATADMQQADNCTAAADMQQEAALPRPAVHALDFGNCTPNDTALASVLSLVDTSHLQCLTCGIAPLADHLPQLPVLRRACLRWATSGMVQALLRHPPVREVVIHNLTALRSMEDMSLQSCSWEHLDLHLGADTTTVARFPLPNIQRCTIRSDLNIDNVEGWIAQFASLANRCPKLICEPAETFSSEVPPEFTRHAFQLHWQGAGLAVSDHLPLLIKACARHLKGTLVLFRFQITPAILATLTACPESVTMLGFRECKLTYGQGVASVFQRDLLRRMPAHITRVAFWGVPHSRTRGPVHVFTRPPPPRGVATASAAAVRLQAQGGWDMALVP